MLIGEAKVDFDAYQIDGPAGNYTVEPKVMEVLSVLVANAGEVVTRESLIDKVWGVGYGGDERLSRAISLLRKSLGDTRGKHKYIQTIPRRGYKLTVEPKGIATKADTEDDVRSTVATADDVPQSKSKRRFLTGALVGGLALAGLIYFGKDSIAPAKADPPLVVIMDSAHPARIYDAQVIAEGATNADILSDILDDLPIRTQKELISPNWHRYEAITQFEPDLIVIHYSGFKQEDSSGGRPKLKLLVEYFEKTDTEFLIYSRAGEEWLDGNMNIILEDLYADNPGLKDRIDIFPLLEYGEPHWMDQSSAQGIKLKIKTLLELD